VAIAANLFFLFNAEDLSYLTTRGLITNVVVVLLSTTVYGFLATANGAFRQVEFTGVFKKLMKLVAPLTIMIAIYTFIQFKYMAGDLIELRIGEIREVWESAGKYNAEEIEKGIANQKEWLSPFIQTTFFFIATLVIGFFTSILVSLVAKKPGM
jgi:hypothetical protein